ncbi:hypothetical protein BH11CYA1_BH11CYA1_26200 [soil metagenome]
MISIPHTYPDSSTEAATFDVSGNVLVRTIRNGNTVTNTYDVINRLATKTPQGQAVVTYSYDLANRLLRNNLVKVISLLYVCRGSSNLGNLSQNLLP